MKLVVKKKGVGYGVNDADAAIVDIANVATLKEGSFLIAFDNGTIIKADGTLTGDAGEKSIIYAMRKGELEVSSPIYVGKSSLVTPVADHAAAAKVATLTSVFAASDADGEHTGLIIYDMSKNVMDPTRRKDYTIYTDDNTVVGDYAAIATKVKEHPLVSDCTYGSNKFTVTFVSGANCDIEGLGAVEKGVKAVTTKLAYGDALTMAEMVEFAHTISPFDGNRDGSIDGDINTFARDYMIEDYPYLVFGFNVNDSVYSTGKSDLSRYGGNLYIAFPEGDLAAANEGFLDIFKAAISGVGNDGGGAGADDPDN